MAAEDFPVILLDGCSLLPFQRLPLHLYEPRYRKMVEAALAADRRFAVAESIMTADGKQGVGPWATLGHVILHESIDGGRHIVLLEGEVRLKVEGLSKLRPFPTLRAEIVPDGDAGPDAHIVLARTTATMERLLAKSVSEDDASMLLNRLQQLAASHPGRFADAAAGHLIQDTNLRRKLLALTNPVVRLRHVQDALARLEVEVSLGPQTPGFDPTLN
jgi:Lon protease-like protein